MSTKRLSKTVIEGGRAGYNKFERRNSHVEVRAQERDYLKNVLADLEHAEEYDIDIRQPVMKGFTDKLAPMYRWLEAQVGRRWDEVRSEVFQKFDTRTTAGRHITFDHLLREVVDTESGFDNHGNMADPNIPVIHTKGRHSYWSVADYYVDQEGILRIRDDHRRRRRFYRNVPSPTEQDLRAAATWLAGRMVAEKGGTLYWLCPTEDIWMASWYDPYGPAAPIHQYPYFGNGVALTYYLWKSGEYQTTLASAPPPAAFPYYSSTLSPITIKNHGDHWEKVEVPYSFRQRGALSQEDLKTFRSFKERIRNDILAFGKGR